MALMGRRASKPKPAADELSTWLKAFLLEGAPPAEGTSEHQAYVETYFLGSEDGIAEAWRKHGARLTKEWIREHPGSRPRYWWLAEFEDDADELPAEGESLEDYRARLGPLMDERERESQASTLRRRGLLVPGELERILPEDFLPIEPEPEAA